MRGRSAARVAAVTADVAVVAREAAGEQEQVESTPRVELHRHLAAIQVADGDKLHKLGAGPCSKAVRVLLAVAMMSLADMPAVHALCQVRVFAGSGIRLHNVVKWIAAQWALQEAEVHRRVVVEVLPLVVEEEDRKILVALEDFAGCLRAQTDHIAPAELAKEAQRHVPVLNSQVERPGLPVGTQTLVAGFDYTARLHHRKAGQAETSLGSPRPLYRIKAAFEFEVELAHLLCAK